MTEISQLLARINNDPAYLKRMNWKEETMRFSERRMEEIALGIDDDEVCDIAVGMMMEYFSLARRERIQERKRRQSKRDDLTVEEKQYITHCVENFLRRIKDIREETATQRNHLKELKNKLSVLEKKYQEKQTDSPAPPKDTPLTVSDVKMKKVLEQLINATDNEGYKMFTDQQQWYAVFRVLSEQHGYPKSMKDFCRIMSDMGMEKTQPPCKYESVKKAKITPQLSCKTELWKSYLNKAGQKDKKQIEIALKLMELLTETEL